MQEIKEIIRALRCSASTRPAGHTCAGCPYLVHEAITEEESPEIYRHLKGLGAQMEWDSCDCVKIAHEAADALEAIDKRTGTHASV